MLIEKSLAKFRIFRRLTTETFKYILDTTVLLNYQLVIVIILLMIGKAKKFLWLKWNTEKIS